MVRWSTRQPAADGGELGGAGLDHPVGQPRQELRPLDHGEEAVGAEHAALGVAQPGPGGEADQRRAERHLRLEVELEALLLEGTIEAPLRRRLDHPPGQRRRDPAADGGEARVVEPAGAAAGLLGAMHRRLGEPEQLVGGAGVDGVEGDAEARGRAQHLAGQGRGRLDHLHQLLHDEGRVLGALQVLDQDGEAVGIEAGDGVGLAQAMAQALGDDAEQPVAGIVAEPLVEGPEPVEIEGDDAGPQAMPAGGGQRLVHAIEEERAVGDAGQPVGGGRRVDPPGVAAAVDGEADAAVEPARSARPCRIVGIVTSDRPLDSASPTPEQDDRPLEAAADRDLGEFQASPAGEAVVDETGVEPVRGDLPEARLDAARPDDLEAGLGRAGEQLLGDVVVLLVVLDDEEADDRPLAALQQRFLDARIGRLVIAEAGRAAQRVERHHVAALHGAALHRSGAPTAGARVAGDGKPVGAWCHRGHERCSEPDLNH